MKRAYHTSGHENQVFLRNESKKDKHWDRKKVLSRQVSNIFSCEGDNAQVKKSERVHCCSNYLLFGIHKSKINDSDVFKLKDARFCKVRLCPLCHSRRSYVWKGRTHDAYPLLRERYPTVRFIHLTLTVKNCPVENLKDTLKMMSSSFKRLSDRMTKNGTIVGFMRSVEITREMEQCSVCKGHYHKKSDCKNRSNHVYTNNCHPHMHVLLAVPSNYFSGDNYLSKEEWSKEWQKSLKCDYKPNVWVSVIKPKRKKNDLENKSEFNSNVDDNELALSSAVKEVAKYSVKVDEEFLESVLKDKAGQQWFLELDRQLAGTRAIGLGGCFKEVFKDTEPDDDEMLKGDDEKEFVAEAYEYRQFFYINIFLAYALSSILKQDKDGIIQGFREKFDQ